MKKLILLLLILSGCEKPEDFCWTCQIAVITRTAEGENVKYCDPDTLCGYSERDAMKYENWKSTEPRVINQCGTLKWSECICVKNE